MKNPILRFALTLAAVFCVLFVTIAATDCSNKTDAVRQAAKASYRLPGLTNDLIAKVSDANAKGLITAEQTRTFGEHLNRVAKAELTFVQTVRAAEAIYKRTGQVPADNLTLIRSMLDDEIIRPFLAILEQYGLLSGPAAAALQVAISAVRLALTTIGSGFGSSLLRLISDTGHGPNGTDRAAATIPKEWSFV